MFCGFNLADRLVWLFPGKRWKGGQIARFRGVGQLAGVKKCFSSAFLRLTACTCWAKRGVGLMEGLEIGDWGFGQKVATIARSSAERDLSSLAVRDGNNRVKRRRTAMNYDEYVRVCMVLPSGFQVL